VINQTPLLGYLAKASRQSTPADGDTRVTIPGTFLPIIEVPFPFFSFFNAPLPGGSDLPVNSWFYQQEYLFNVTVGLGIARLGPGLWRIQVWHDKIRLGAISDLTSTTRLDMIDVSTALTVTLTKISNDVAVPESYSREFEILVPTDQSYQFSRISAVGAGTGTCLSNLKLLATRLF